MENILLKLVSEGILEKGVYMAAFSLPNSNHYLVLKDGKYGVINTKGKIVVSCKYVCISPQKNGTYKAIRRNGNYFDTDIFDSYFNYI